MKLCVVIAAACGALIVWAPTAHAQADRRFGFVIAYPTSVGLEQQAADRLAIRFDGAYRHSTVESSATPTPFPVPSLPNFPRVAVFGVRSSTSHTGAALGVSVLLDLHRSDALRLYLAPRIAVLIAKNEIETTITGLGFGDLAALTFPANRESTSRTPSGGDAITKPAAHGHLAITMS